MLQKTDLVDPLGHKPPFLEFIIEGQTLKSFEQYKSGQEIKLLASIPLDTELYLSIAKPWTDELIENHTKVDLARPGLEFFYVRKKLRLTIDGLPFTWYKQYINESDIRALGKVDPQDDIYLKVARPFEDELIEQGTRVDLARPGREDFVAKPKPINSLIVNAQVKSWTQLTITFEQVVTLAFGSYSDDAQKAYTVAFSKGPKSKPKGIMVKGDLVEVKNDMKFDVSATDKS